MTPTSPDLLLMLLGDARLPVAGHTQSAGLEPAVLQGVTADQVPSFIAGRLDTVVRTEAATAVVALHTLDRDLPVDLVVRAWAVRTPSAAQRRASRLQARAFLRVATRLWPDSAPLATVATNSAAPRPVAVAAAAAGLGLGPAALARLIGYDDVQSVASAALKLLPLDPVVTTGWVHDALPQVTRLAGEVAALTLPDRIPASSAPQNEVWAEAHARTTRRLFRA